MPRRYLTPAESRDLRITGQGDQIERDENDQDFIDYATSEPSEGSCSDGSSSEDNYVAELLLNAHDHVLTEEEKIDAILNGELVGIDLENLSVREHSAFQTFVDELAIQTGIVRPRPPMEREVRFCMPEPEPEVACALQPQSEVAYALQPQPNLLQVQPEEVDNQLLELAFAELPEVNMPQLMQILGAPGDPGDPNNGSVVVHDCDGPDLKHFTVQGGRNKRRSRKRNKKTKSKRKSKRKTRKRKSIR